jgi:hypothetical protein
VGDVYERDQSWGKALLTATICAFSVAPCASCVVAAATNKTGGLAAGLIIATWALVVVLALLVAKLVFRARYRAKMARGGIRTYQAGQFRSWE